MFLIFSFCVRIVVVTTLFSKIDCKDKHFCKVYNIKGQKYTFYVYKVWTIRSTNVLIGWLVFWKVFLRYVGLISLWEKRIKLVSLSKITLNIVMWLCTNVNKEVYKNIYIYIFTRCLGSGLGRDTELHYVSERGYYSFVRSETNVWLMTTLDQQRIRWHYAILK